MAPDETKKQEERRGSSKDRRVNDADRRGSGRVDVDEKTEDARLIVEKTARITYQGIGFA